VVMIEFDFEGDTVSRLGMPDSHRHWGSPFRVQGSGFAVRAAEPWTL